jgi:hypothetical protein
VAIGLFWPNFKRAWRFCAGVAAGFLVPVLPFAVLAPRQFYDGVIVAQIERVSAARAPVWSRLANILGIFSPTPAQKTLVIVIAIAVAVMIAALLIAAWLVTHRPPPLLERFVVLTSALVIIMFCLADQFYYHFVAFLVPFLAASIALPLSRLVAAAGAPDSARHVLWWLTAGVAAVAILFVAVTQFQAQSRGANVIGPAPRALERIIPPGACVLTDQVSMTIVANRFYSDVPGCSQMVDGLATDVALSGGKKPSDGAGYVPAVAAMWRQAFAHAQLVLLSPNNAGRIAWTPSLKAYFKANFVRLHSPWHRVTLYKHKGFDLQRARAAAHQ